MTINTQKLRDLVTFDFELPVSVRDAVDDACDHIDLQTAEIARLCEVLRKIESVGGDATSGDGHARCKQIARAALSGESKC